MSVGDLWAKRERATRVLVLPGILAFAALNGCHHRRVQPVLLSPQTPVELLQVPEPDAPLVASQPSKLPAVPVTQVVEKPKKVRRRAPKPAPAATPPQPVAIASPAKKPADVPTTTPAPAQAQPDAAVVEIGALTVGGEQSPRALQEANDLLTANERRLSAMTADMLKAQAELVGKVRNFQKDAQVALHSGDAEGAKTLATKGKLLLDDLDKSETK